ncbi:MAG: type II secretion system protein [bacterium]|nr:type II secretion system protein [bacterium]
MKTKNIKSFTLIEVIITIAIFSMLSVIVLKTFEATSKVTFNTENIIYNKNTIELVFEYYKSLPYEKLYPVKDMDISYLFLDPKEHRNLRLFLTIQFYKTSEMKRINLRAVWGNKKNPYELQMETLRYRYGL